MPKNKTQRAQRAQNRLNSASLYMNKTHKNKINRMDLLIEAIKKVKKENMKKVHAAPLNMSKLKQVRTPEGYLEYLNNKGIIHGVSKGNESGNLRTDPAPAYYTTETKVFEPHQNSAEIENVINYIKTHFNLLFETYYMYPVLKEQEKTDMRNYVKGFLNNYINETDDNRIKYAKQGMENLFDRYPDFYEKVKTGFNKTDEDISKITTEAQFFQHYDKLVMKYKKFALDNLKILLFVYYILDSLSIIDYNAYRNPTNFKKPLLKNILNVIFPQSSE